MRDPTPVSSVGEMTDVTIRPFRIDVPQADVDDLRERLRRTRWPDEPAGAGWDYGLPLDYAKELVEHWATGYDWRAHEKALNATPQFMTTVDGADLHFLHVRSAQPDATPLLLTHGWPGSILEFVGLVGPLTDPPAGTQPFDVVIPSIPGFGLSGPTRDRGWSVSRIAGAFAELMSRLGYARFGAHGGDWGAFITRELAVTAPHAVLGAHLTMLPSAVAHPGAGADDLPDLTDDDRAEIRASAERFAKMRRGELGYGILQSTRPQTLAYGLTDSPAGQLAWIAEKFAAWTDHDGDPATAVPRDVLLTNVSLYWFTRTAGSSARIYHEHYQQAQRSDPAPSTVPTAVAVFPRDTSLPVRRLAERTDPIARWTVMPRGGHFPGLEQPDALVADLRAFFAGRR
jgi:pimeloyl-ACP methyl ester carboxylesterase